MRFYILACTVVLVTAKPEAGFSYNGPPSILKGSGGGELSCCQQLELLKTQFGSVISSGGGGINSGFNGAISSGGGGGGGLNIGSHDGLISGTTSGFVGGAGGQTSFSASNTNEIGLNSGNSGNSFINAGHSNSDSFNSGNSHNQFGSASSQSLNSIGFGGSSSNNLQSNSELVQKHIYVHVPPQDTEDSFQRAAQQAALLQPKKHYKIIFIKAPSTQPQINAAQLIAQAGKTEEKTLVYVLVKKPDEPSIQEIQHAAQNSVQHNKPEVYFIKYKNKHSGSSGSSFGSNNVGVNAFNGLDQSAGFSSSGSSNFISSSQSQSSHGSQSSSISGSGIPSTSYVPPPLQSTPTNSYGPPSIIEPRNPSTSYGPP